MPELIWEAYLYDCERGQDVYVFPFSSEELARKFVKDFIRAWDAA
jgi:hypothetical protein